ncbi:hypothetical protein, partial [Streptomyces neyagawaensis]|uniref:hypothetical protein n=1 Tax=Streptomyces neyagawaensis TaxID=42238 RepID=UPI00198117DF
MPAPDSADVRLSFGTEHISRELPDAAALLTVVRGSPVTLSIPGPGDFSRETAHVPATWLRPAAPQG